MKESNELFRLCRSVYEATGWETSDWYDLDPDGIPEEYLCTTEDKIDENDYIPNYTTDYLLEKLPYKIGKANSAIWLRLGKTRNSFTVCYMGSDLVCIYDFEADTPLKALLRLTLKLHEENML